MATKGSQYQYVTRSLIGCVLIPSGLKEPQYPFQNILRLLLMLFILQMCPKSVSSECRFRLEKFHLKFIINTSSRYGVFGVICRKYIRKIVVFLNVKDNCMNLFASSRLFIFILFEVIAIRVFFVLNKTFFQTFQILLLIQRRLPNSIGTTYVADFLPNIKECN